MTYQVRPLDASIDVADFKCGSELLNENIRRYASQDVRKNVARVFVAAPETNLKQLAGYFTLNAGSVRCTSFPESLAKRLPRYPIPIALVGRLAVDNEFQGRGLGSILLADACRKVAQASAVLAVAGIIVDAKDHRAVSFYEHFGFIPLQGQTNRMLLPMAAFQSN